MFFAPFPLLFAWLAGVLSLLLLGGGVYLVWAWYVGVLVGTAYLVAGVIMTAWALLGRYVVLLFRRAGPDEPHSLRADSEIRLPRPDGTTLYVERYGSPGAPTIVLTHGAGANRTSWYYLIRALAEHFHVLVWDMPGLGHSEKARNGDYSLERHARDLQAVVELAPAGPIILAGHSMGGMVVLTFCRLFADQLTTRVRGLVLLDTSYTNPARTTTASGVVRAIQKPVLEPLLHVTAWLAPLVWVMSGLGYLNGSSHILGTLFGFAGSETRGQLDLAARYTVLAWPGVQARETLAMFRYDATAILGAISVPTLVCTADLDRLIVPETARVMADRIPQAEEVRVEPAGHMSLFERHDDLTQHFEAFARRVLSPAAEGTRAH
jgi:pimeloyl-ACP methyl ester carboxylesterase